MNTIVFEVLQMLNEIDVRGERNHVLLVGAIQKLKPLQHMQMVPASAEQDKQMEEGKL